MPVVVVVVRVGVVGVRMAAMPDDGQAAMPGPGRAPGTASCC